MKEKVGPIWPYRTAEESTPSDEWKTAPFVSTFNFLTIFYPSMLFSWFPFIFFFYPTNNSVISKTNSQESAQLVRV